MSMRVAGSLLWRTDQVAWSTTDLDLAWLSWYLSTGITQSSVDQSLGTD
jgi:hypothetical protein